MMNFPYTNIQIYNNNLAHISHVKITLLMFSLCYFNLLFSYNYIFLNLTSNLSNYHSDNSIQFYLL